jgi:pyridinium-3,5-bisthiocarboxylic acid mononucleotide nickel chelatase
VTLRGAHLHIDCASGAAGDMMLAALIDLGVPVDAISEALDQIGAGRGRLTVARVVKHGIAAVDVKVDTTGALEGAGLHVHDAHHHERAAVHVHRHIHVDAQGHVHEHLDADDHGHDHHAHEHHAHDHAHYHYADIRARIASSDLGGGAKRRALDIFDRLARAEAKLHGKTVDDVAFHEVGAIDSVVDIVGTAAALDWLSPASVTCASVAMGHGTLKCAHGVLPVPAPAALEVLREAGGVMADGGAATELCTPTGAAILAATVTSWTAPPTGRALAVGWGAGDTELADRANVLRVVAMDPVAPLAGATADRVWQLDANLDDMSPELCGPALDALFAAGALDAWWTPITMKKGRPALMLSALADEARRDAVAAAILRETTTIGVRYALRDRTVLARKIVEVATRYGAIPVKVAGDNAAPEYEACAAAAKQHGVAVKAVFAAALAAYESTRG